MKEKILEVSNVSIYLVSIDGKIRILASGLVSSTGWKDGELILHNKAIPEDGIYKFDFKASPPKDCSLPVLRPIDAVHIFDKEPENFKGVQVYSATNSITKLIDEKVDAASADKKIMPYLETLIGLEVTDTQLKIIVPSNGCTSKDNFKTYIVTEPTGRYLMVFRIKEDYCTAYMPDGVELEYDLSELGLEPKESFKVSNNFTKVKK